MSGIGNTSPGAVFPELVDPSGQVQGVSSYDTQAMGWQNDGSTSGLIRTMLARGGYVLKPFRTGGFLGVVTGAGAATLNTSDNDPLQSTGVTNGPFLSVPSGINQGLSIWQWFYGTVFGLSWQKGVNGNTVDFSVMIDGVAYHVVNRDVDPSSQAVSTTPNLDCLEVIATDLDDSKPHLAIIEVQGGASGGNLGYQFHGYLVEQRRGYTWNPALKDSTATAAVPLALTSVGSALQQAGSGGIRGVSRIYYYNGAASTTTISLSDTATTAGIFWTAVLAAGASAYIDLADAGLGSLLKHMASQAGAQYKVVGGIL